MHWDRYLQDMRNILRYKILLNIFDLRQYGSCMYVFNVNITEGVPSFPLKTLILISGELN